MSQGNHSSVNVYPVVDALGFPLQAARDDTGAMVLIGGATQTYKDKKLGLTVPYQLQVEETTWQGLTTTPVGVLVRSLGDLGIVVLNDSQRSRLETFVLDMSKYEGRSVLTTWWSRMMLMQTMQEGLVAHYLWDPENAIWEATPKPRRWAEVYQEGRDAGLSSGGAMELADYVAHGLVEDAPGIAKKWRISSKKRRQELLDKGA